MMLKQGSTLISTQTLGENEADCTHEMSCREREYTRSDTKLRQTKILLTLKEVLMRQDGVKRCDQSKMKETAFLTSLNWATSTDLEAGTFCK